MARFQRSFPFQLFQLLDPDVAVSTVYDMPVCLRDELSTCFFRRYSEAAHFPCAEALALLESWAILIELDISNIEAGHSSIRELTKQRARGFMPSLEEVSAKWLCKFVGKHYAETVPQAGAAKAKAKPKPRPKQRANPGHGGAYRAFVAEQGLPVDDPRLKERYAALTDEQRDYFRQQGLNMMQQGRMGVKRPRMALQQRQADLVAADSTEHSCADFWRFMLARAMLRRPFGVVLPGDEG